jgi:hypothetical protein
MFSTTAIGIAPTPLWLVMVGESAVLRSLRVLPPWPP